MKPQRDGRVRCSAWLDCTVEIRAMPKSEWFEVDLDSIMERLNAVSLRGLKNPQYQKVVKRVPLFVGKLPKVIVEALKREHRVTATLGKPSGDLASLFGSGIDDDGPIQPTSGDKLVDDGLESVAIQFWVVWHDVRVRSNIVVG